MLARLNRSSTTGLPLTEAVSSAGTPVRAEMRPEASPVEFIRSQAEWDGALAQLGNAHFLQSYAWGEFKRLYGWHADRILIGDAGQPLGYASLLTRRLAPGLWVGYVPRGPILIQPCADTLAVALASLETLARRRRLLWLKVDPEIWDEEATAWAAPTMQERGWRKGSEVQFRNSVVLDLSEPEEALLARMKPKARYNIRLADRKGVSVDQAAAEGLDELYSLYRETANRDGFIVRPLSYYRALWSSLLTNDMATVLFARHNGRTLAGIVVVAYGPNAWYFHGASANEGRNLMPTYLLQWHAMLWARQRGCRTYDMWGAPEVADTSDGMAGVLRFKLGFGGTLKQGLGAWDYTPWPALYSLYGYAAPRLLAIGRQFRWRSQQHV